MWFPRSFCKVSSKKSNLPPAMISPNLEMSLYQREAFTIDWISPSAHLAALTFC